MFFWCFFRNFIDAPGGPPEAKRQWIPCTKQAPNLIVWHRLFFVIFDCFFIDFGGSALKDNEYRAETRVFLICFRNFIDAPDGLPRLKDNENRAETLPKNVRFEKWKKCVFRDPQPKTNKNKLPEFNPQRYLWSGGGPKPLIFVPPPVPRSNSSLLGISFTVFLFGNYTSGRSPEAKRQWKLDPARRSKIDTFSKDFN